MLRITIGAITLLLVSCGIVRNMETDQARKRMLKSKQAYLNCLKQLDHNISNCNSLKAEYEADVDAYQVLKWGHTQKTNDNQRSH